MLADELIRRIKADSVSVLVTGLYAATSKMYDSITVVVTEPSLPRAYPMVQDRNQEKGGRDRPAQAEYRVHAGPA